jgi:hypothetical protein
MNKLSQRFTRLCFAEKRRKTMVKACNMASAPLFGLLRNFTHFLPYDGSRYYKQLYFQEKKKGHEFCGLTLLIVYLAAVPRSCEATPIFSVRMP